MIAYKCDICGKEINNCLGSIKFEYRDCMKVEPAAWLKGEWKEVDLCEDCISKMIFEDKNISAKKDRFGKYIVGEEVYIGHFKGYGVVIGVNPYEGLCGVAYILRKDGSVVREGFQFIERKTGKYYPQINVLLKRMNRKAQAKENENQSNQI